MFDIFHHRIVGKILWPQIFILMYKIQKFRKLEKIVLFRSSIVRTRVYMFHNTNINFLLDPKISKCWAMLEKWSGSSRDGGN